MWIALAAVVGLPLLVFVVIFNGLVFKRNRVENAFSTIDVLLKKRYDLIPNLVATVKQYMTHEADTLTKVTELRAKATSGTLSSDEKVDLNNQIGKMIGGIMVAVEAYPDLKASENFQQLQRSLNEIEEQLSASRRAFNASVMDFNNAVEMFPTNVVAGMMGYTRRKMFEIPESERENPNVKELFSA